MFQWVVFHFCLFVLFLFLLFFWDLCDVVYIYSIILFVSHRLPFSFLSLNAGKCREVTANSGRFVLSSNLLLWFSKLSQDHTSGSRLQNELASVPLCHPETLQHPGRHSSLMEGPPRQQHRHCYSLRRCHMSSAELLVPSLWVCLLCACVWMRMCLSPSSAMQAWRISTFGMIQVLSEGAGARGEEASRTEASEGTLVYLHLFV